MMSDLPCRLCIPKKLVSVFDDIGDGNTVQSRVRALAASFIPPGEDGEVPELVGHQSGLPQQYPQSPDRVRQRAGSEAPVLQTVESMKIAFAVMGLDAVELDVQVARGRSDNELYVIHDRPKPRDMADDVVGPFLRRNRLVDVLESFAVAGYYQRRRKVYLELKTESIIGSLKDEDEWLVAQTIEVIDQVASGCGAQSDLFRSQIGFASFNDRALARASELSAANIHSFHFIASTSRPLCRAFARLGGEARLNRAVMDRLVQAAWLNGVWFSPGWVPDYGSVFGALNAQRGSELSYGMGAYYTSPARFRRLLDRAENRAVNDSIQSIIIEFARSSLIGAH